MEGYFYELDQLEKELKILRGSIKKINDRRKIIVNNITNSMQTSGILSYSYRGKKYKLIEQQIHKRKPLKKIQTEALMALKDSGFSTADSQRFLEILENVYNENAKVQYKLKN